MKTSNDSTGYFAGFLKRHGLNTTDIIKSGKDLKDYIEDYVVNSVIRDLEVQGKHDCELMHSLLRIALDYSHVDWDFTYATFRLGEKWEKYE